MEYVKQKFLEGLALAFGVSGAVQKKIVGYLYNGVQLPALPEWDRVTYPYAVIKYHFADDAYTLYVKRTPFVYESVILKAYGFNVGGAMYYKIANSAWQYGGTKGEDNFTYFTDVTTGAQTAEVTWCNVDILSEDETVFKAASEPVPVYE